MRQIYDASHDSLVVAIFGWHNKIDICRSRCWPVPCTCHPFPISFQWLVWQMSFSHFVPKRNSMHPWGVSVMELKLIKTKNSLLWCWCAFTLKFYTAFWRILIFFVKTIIIIIIADGREPSRARRGVLKPIKIIILVVARQFDPSTLSLASHPNVLFYFGPCSIVW